MANHKHHYKLTTQWKGNKGTGTSDVAAYKRTHTITMEGKPALHLTTDNPDHGDKTMLNPEDLLVAAISSCHMMSYLYLCAKSKVIIVDYTDEATGIMIENDKGGGQFKEVTLNPVCVVKDSSMVERATRLHHKAGEICYIASSINFKVHHHPVISVQK